MPLPIEIAPPQSTGHPSHALLGCEGTHPTLQCNPSLLLGSCQPVPNLGLLLKCQAWNQQKCVTEMTWGTLQGWLRVGEGPEHCGLVVTAGPQECNQGQESLSGRAQDCAMSEPICFYCRPTRANPDQASAHLSSEPWGGGGEAPLGPLHRWRH